MQAFRALAAGLPASLPQAALECSTVEHPHLDVAAALRELKALAEGFERFRAGQGDDEPFLLIARLSAYFFGELGFHGNDRDYYDPANSHLHLVLARRKGIPITLSILYRELAAAAGVALAGINLPGHFMLAFPATTAGKRVYLDVHRGGTLLSWRECVQRMRGGSDGRTLLESAFPPMADRDILARMLRNLKGVHASNAVAKAVRVQRQLVELLPDSPSELRELAALHHRAGKPGLACRALDELLHRFPWLADQESLLDERRVMRRDAALAN